MRGDNIFNKIQASNFDGSPPHAWGQFINSGDCNSSIRFTPTCVGTIPNNSNLYPDGTVHPHMRGDNCEAMQESNPLFGSPPHAWGQFCLNFYLIRQFRFTPTCVGTIRYALPGVAVYVVHPHMRGDNYLINLKCNNRYGSPPHAWGQLLLLYFINLLARFTPTSVGTMPVPSAIFYAPWVHPHKRGDNTNETPAKFAFNGSPPQAWGQFKDSGLSHEDVRFTPTSVGTIFMLRSITLIWHGSPPQAWGQF